MSFIRVIRQSVFIRDSDNNMGELNDPKTVPLSLDISAYFVVQYKSLFVKGMTASRAFGMSLHTHCHGHEKGKETPNAKDTRYNRKPVRFSDNDTVQSRSKGDTDNPSR